MKDSPDYNNITNEDNDNDNNNLTDSYEEALNNNLGSIILTNENGYDDGDDNSPSKKKSTKKLEKEMLISDATNGNDNSDGDINTNIDIELQDISLTPNSPKTFDSALSPKSNLSRSPSMTNSPRSPASDSFSDNDSEPAANKKSLASSIEEISLRDEESNKLNQSTGENPGITRQQWIRVAVVYAAVLSDGLSLTLVQPFLPEILKERWGFTESQTGFVSGLLIGIYSLARFFSSFTLGHLSDRFGRKPFLLLSLISTSIGTIIFAFMPNVYLAMLVRFAEETHPKFAKAGISAVEISKTQKDFSLIEGLRILSKDKKIMMLLLLGSVNSFSNGGLLLSFVLFASLSIEHRGLGMDASENGIIFTILGFVGFLFQITFFKRLSKSIGLKKQYLLGTVLLCIGMMVFPLTYTGYLMQGKAMVWVLICIIVPLTSIGFMQCLPIVGGMVANAAKPELQGLTQGTSQSLNSLLRSFGPAISGAIFTLSVTNSIPFLLFAILSFTYLILAIIGLYLPPSVDVNSKS
ncbi:hypothetical protein PPL_06742 [Heterostelium album PN500]|uniref:Major facilitator superfamily (MFS) profile domain-containing protein n=1 Tax=Heterostelium pallidum (strain ATCC 26659 / Pp 5 / PN500) TaxID=670386 RepID=D3BFK8_HETP5|nr:hypothetical protein PPL_06742 [Heterostelium album PN500]EFA79922.1 hypothetical protein PPL_06742 [Heterostelium album PN500]|eukprot:XP_020432042.1 hypothetical protein PPL_06742 [Heterostelium album PN500]